MSAAIPQEVGVKAVPKGRVKRSRASLIGGIASGCGVFALTVALAGGLSTASVAIGLVLGAGLAVWVRLADL